MNVVAGWRKLARSLLEAVVQLPPLAVGRNDKGRRMAALVCALSRSLVLIHTQFLFQVVDIHAAFAEAFVADQHAVQGNVGLDAVDYDLV